MVKVVYFSSATNNTKRFVDKLGLPNERIPLRRSDPALHVDEPYVLIVPTYGRHQGRPQAGHRLPQRPENCRCVGVISSGNTNFGTAYWPRRRHRLGKTGHPTCTNSSSSEPPRTSPGVREGLEEFWQRISPTPA